MMKLEAHCIRHNFSAALENYHCPYCLAELREAGERERMERQWKQTRFPEGAEL